jgi:hypothetical protein
MEPSQEYHPGRTGSQPAPLSSTLTSQNHQLKCYRLWYQGSKRSASTTAIVRGEVVVMGRAHTARQKCVLRS